MWHSCGKYTLEELFVRSEPQVIKLFRKFAKMVRACGPVTIIPQKTRVVFQVRVRFAGCYPRKNYLVCAIALRQQLKSRRFVRTEKFANRFVGHYFNVESEADLNAELQGWLHESYKVGAQE
ncbi:MAG TPA: DUF5655 domain-containing protein [Pyrinomonadaceae bacterium]|nr:DUF5655 domain-containing protein [Pyrinomonadaceae bacterium]